VANIVILPKRKIQEKSEKVKVSYPDPPKKERLNTENYKLEKRAPRKLYTNSNDIYVNNKTDFKAQLARCFKCLETEDCVFLHGLGGAVERAVNIALELQLKSSNPLETEVTTSTVNLIDDFEPLEDTEEFKSKDRQTSAVHIKVYKTIKLPPLSKK